MTADAEIFAEIMEIVQINKVNYKYCFVPQCRNTTTTTPDKNFFTVPREKKMRDKWCKIVKRKVSLSEKSVRYCCEDHFDMENDMENYIKWKLMGGKKKLRKGVVPHKFSWTEKPLKERTAVEKRRLREFYERVLSPEIHHEYLQAKPVEFIPVVEDVVEDPIQVAEQEAEPKKTFKNRSVQCCMKLKPSVRSVRTNTDDRHHIAMETKIKQQRRKIETLEKKLEKLERYFIEQALTQSDNEEEEIEDFKRGSSEEYCPEREIKSSTKLIKTRSELKALRPEVY